ncbi:alpha/beta hydrolase [Kutzneria viridogrisea]
MHRVRVTTPDGTQLAVHETGPHGAPAVVLLHGWAAAATAWPEQISDELRVLAVDLRGHGESDVPSGGYDDPDVWAGDVSAVLDHVGAPAVLVGWSYGGLVITDYLRRHGTRGVAGVVLVGAITEIGRGRSGGHIGPAMRAALPDALSDDPSRAVPALLDLTVSMTADPAPGADVQRALATSLRVPPSVRAALFRRDVASADVLERVDVPALLVHGTKDAVVDPKATDYAAGLIPGAEVSWYADTGHMPFVERADQFRADLVTFVHRCAATASRIES